MEVQVYNWEHFKRTIWRFAWFGVIIAIVIVLSLWHMNFFGAIVLFLVAWGYILFSLTKNKIIPLGIREGWVSVEARLRTRASLEGFAVEYDTKTREIKNILFSQQKGDVMIFTFADTQENIEAFIENLQKNIPLQASAELSSVDKVLRRFKL